MFARPASSALLLALSGLAGLAPAQNPFVKALPAGTIGYEILTGLGARYLRVYRGSGR